MKLKIHEAKDRTLPKKVQCLRHRVKTYNILTAPLVDSLPLCIVLSTPSIDRRDRHIGERYIENPFISNVPLNDTLKATAVNSHRVT